MSGAQVRVGTGVTPVLMEAGDGSLGRRVAALGGAHLDFLAIADHVTFRGGTGLDGLLNAAAVLAWQDRLPVQVGVYLLAARHPTVVARQLADIERLHPGRLAFAVGVGGEDRREFEAVGVDPGTRGARTDEGLDVVRALLTRPDVTYAGRHVQIDSVTINPRPTAVPPILIGGRSEAAVRRTARTGDGWQALWVSAGRFASAVTQIAELAEVAGRSPARWLHGLNVWCNVDASADRARGELANKLEQAYGQSFDTFERYCPTGSAEQVAEFLVPYVTAGCTSFNLTMPDGTTERAVTATEEVRRLLLDHLGRT